MARNTKILEAEIANMIREAKFNASQSQVLPLPENISEQKFTKLVNEAPASQILALFEQSKTHSNLVGLDLGRVAVNSNGLDQILARTTYVA